ncbi:hypothetical protein E8E11_011040 [Didymella keratinophila]|nr:hypothetical protein E8E11_011040 [Didymella keratinophila]
MLTSRNGERKQYKIELCSVDAKDETTYEPMDAVCFGTVNNLAYPHNSFLGKARFVAVVKCYFLLAFRAGEFDEDPGFAVTTTWQNDLKGACDELIAAPQRERQKEQKDKIKNLEKKAELLRREIAKKNKEGEETVKEQATEFQQTDAMLSKPKKEDSDEDEENENEMKKEEVEADENTQAERERKWMQLYHKRVEMLQQMRRLEDEMSVGERLDLFEKAK